MANVFKTKKLSNEGETYATQIDSALNDLYALCEDASLSAADLSQIKGLLLPIHNIIKEALHAIYGA